MYANASIFIFITEYVPLYGYTTCWISIHQPIAIWVLSTLCLLRIKRLWTFVSKLLYSRLGFHSSWVEVPGHIVTPCSTFRGTVFQGSCATLHSYQQCEFVSPHFCHHSLLPVFFIVTIPMKVKCYLVRVLICIS